MTKSCGCGASLPVFGLPWGGLKPRGFPCAALNRADARLHRPCWEFETIGYEEVALQTGAPAKPRRSMARNSNTEEAIGCSKSTAGGLDLLDPRELRLNLPDV